MNIDKSGGAQLWMGNEAIAYGALHAGITLASGYPGTPSSEAIETLAKLNPPGVHVEWSVNEKAALEVAAGASYAGARVLVTMKQVGLNVASDPLISLNYVGVNGGMVILVADDPGPISSQTEQDTRRFAQFARLPVLDPTTPEEAYEMTRAAFDISERFRVPVLLRPTTRICHACVSITPYEPLPQKKPEGFHKGSEWVIFPRLAYESKKRIVAREAELMKAQERFNVFEVLPKRDDAPSPEPERLGVICGGVAYAYAREVISRLNISCRMMKIGAPNPFQEEAVRKFLNGLTCVYVCEELDSVIEDAIRPLCAEMNITMHGKRDGTFPCAGEYSAAMMLGVYSALTRQFARGLSGETIEMRQGAEIPTPPKPPIRPPVLCAGCPHRASFYAVKRAMAGHRAIYCGDIGCYTLGNAMPLDMVDTCLCMGAGITIAQGLRRAEPDTPVFAFIGDSTFFHSGMTGVLNAMYNQSDIIICVLDNRTTGMTGQQPHPGMGKTATGESTTKADIEKILSALGVNEIRRVNPFDLDKAIESVHETLEDSGVRAIIFEAPCIAVAPRDMPMTVVESDCVGCRICVKALGCPAMSIKPNPNALRANEVIAAIDPALCTGCGLCAKICPRECIDSISGLDDGKETRA
ncbi:indolepyruvate ferredoxin oxidoreductase subunit alpha [Clostridia bacterium]|nr:indolepyruvate ferredoxin oxidoreductase subunit alpha [Clostridia bacterium]